MIRKRFLGIGLLLAVLVSTANAAPITNTVTVGDKEWAQVNLFSALSWNDISAQCSMTTGACSEGATLNGFSMAGWTWASLIDVGLLFNLISGGGHSGGITVYTENNSTWGPGFFDELGFLPTFQFTEFRLVQGSVRELTDSGNAYRPFVMDTFNPASTTLATTAFNIPGSGSSAIGAWFFRPLSADPVPVPAPATLPLFGFAFGLMLALRRFGFRR